MYRRRLTYEKSDPHLPAVLIPTWALVICPVTVSILLLTASTHDWAAFIFVPPMSIICL